MDVDAVPDAGADSEGGYKSPTDEYDGFYDALSDSSGDEDCERCAYCYSKAKPRAKKSPVRCERCKEVYCEEGHRAEHKKRHATVCKALAALGEDRPPLDEDVPVKPQERSALLRLPNEVLLRILQNLDAWSLIEVSLTCRALRRAARDPRAWLHVKYPGVCENVRLATRKPTEFDVDNFMAVLHAALGIGGTPPSLLLMRLAPAMGELKISRPWPPLNLARCTRRVRVVKVNCSGQRWDNHFDDVQRLFRLLRHYKGHVEVLKLTELKSVCLSKGLDSLGLKELYVDGQLVRAFPGSSKSVTSLKADDTYDGMALSELIKDCSHSLLSFRVWPAGDISKIPWATQNGRGWFSYYSGPEVYVALKQCSLLQEVRIPTWGNLALLGNFPELRKLSLIDFGKQEHHGNARRFLRSTTALRRVESLTLRMGYYVHRGLLEPLARACLNVRSLRLIFKQGTEKRGFTASVDLPRDLLNILGLMGDLESLELYNARVPCTVFDGLAAGQLPNLTHLLLRYIGVTPKARSAFESLRSSRPDLKVVVKGSNLRGKPGLDAAVRNWNAAKIEGDYWVCMPRRCRRAVCNVDSDADEEDPVPGDHLPGNESDFDMDDTERSCQPLWCGRDPSDSEELEKEKPDEEDGYDSNEDLNWGCGGDRDSASAAEEVDDDSDEVQEEEDGKDDKDDDDDDDGEDGDEDDDDDEEVGDGDGAAGDTGESGLKKAKAIEGDDDADGYGGDVEDDDDVAEGRVPRCAGAGPEGVSSQGCSSQ